MPGPTTGLLAYAAPLERPGEAGSTIGWGEVERPGEAEPKIGWGEVEPGEAGSTIGWGEVERPGEAEPKIGWGEVERPGEAEPKIGWGEVERPGEAEPKIGWGEAVSTALLTDHYELTMLAAALRDGTAQRRCVFEVFARHLPPGRRYGVVAGTARLLDAIEAFHFRDPEIDELDNKQVVDSATLEWLGAHRFTGDIEGYTEGELYFPGSPILTVRGSFAEAILLETLVLSVLNHDTAIASAAARMVCAAGDRPCIEMGSRRTHEEAAVAAARAAYLAGFAATSNLAAGARYGVPTSGTSAHAYTLLHDDEGAAFAAQVAALGGQTTLLVDTFDVMEGIRLAVGAAGPQLGAIRLDSGDLGGLAVQARELLDSLGATATRIVVTSDLDEYAIAALAAAPVDGYGVGTSLVTGSGAPTAGLVYKLVEVDGRPVAKTSTGKPSRGGRKFVVRRHNGDGVMTAEVVTNGGSAQTLDEDRGLQVPLLVQGRRPDAGVSPQAQLETGREHHRRVMASLPAAGRKLSRGEPAIDTDFVELRP